MAAVGNVPGILSVKTDLDKLKSDGMIKSWELPYENLLTRLSAAVFFLSPSSDEAENDIWTRLESHENLQYRPNEEKTLSELAWRVEFPAENAG